MRDYGPAERIRTLHRGRRLSTLLDFMTPHEKAIHAINARLERLQVNLREAKGENAQRFMFQSLVATIASAEALNDYIKMVGKYAQRRHAELKQKNETLAAQHADLLKSGQDLLEKLKANPTDRALRKEIEVVQRNMETVQKDLRRGTNALQRELSPSLAMIDEMAVNIRRLCEAEHIDALKRQPKSFVDQVRELYAAQSALPKGIIDAPAWEQAATTEIGAATEFYDAFARAAHQAIMALELMTLALSEEPPRSAEDATERTGAAVAGRLKDITNRFTGSSGDAAASPAPSA